MTSRHEDGPPHALPPAEHTDGHLDANAAGGALREIFTVDLTAAAGTCVGCAHAFILAQALLYTQAPGLVGRCPSCEDVVFRLVRAPDRAWLDLRGVTCLEFALPEPPTI
ncbi:DUF6510 family protein [Sphaerisporangium sp. TRM90804]|uniref:DUF6510 family protein n=1 Tax=Sphaerisporangium sp. TRM90804 TaxID=3031113 RepID=UPI0024480429|nr:DUF6510 family protein [Sphaerisporangium sp. TRM90804]MDH2427290.1 DUF6510 family protein [Sphaerisporangium sp. TRM90804]